MDANITPQDVQNQALTVEKACKKCLKNLSIENFGINTKAKDGLKTWCKSCCKTYNEERYKAKHPDIIEKVRLWQKNNPKKLLEYQKKYRNNKN